MKTQSIRIFLAVVAALALVACGSGGTTTVPGADALIGADSPAVDVASCASPLAVRIVALDPWGRRPAAPVSIVVQAVGSSGSWSSTSGDLALPTVPAKLAIAATSEGLLPAQATAEIVAADPAASTVTPDPATPGARAALSLAPASQCPRVTVYVGLDHPWFAASGRPSHAGNKVDLFLDGEDFWSRVMEDLALARDEIRGTTWWWQSDFELYRPEATHVEMDEEARRPQTVLAVLQAVPAYKRILINRFMSKLSAGMAYLNNDPEIRAFGTAVGDDFEVMIQPNPTDVPLHEDYAGRAPDFVFADRVKARSEFWEESFPGAGKVASALDDTFDASSYHQKAFVVDSRVAFVIGMNVKSTDWDTSDHKVFEPRRMKFQSSVYERQRVRDKLQLPDLGPRKDYGIRIEGPAAVEVDDVLRDRWDQSLKEGALFSDLSTAFVPAEWTGDLPGTIECQVVATMPEPIPEQSILETWQKALSRAEKYIFIEDQYFRMPILNDAIVSALDAHPALRLIVITKPMTDSDGGKKHTIACDEVLREAAGDRYLLLQTKSFDAVGRTDPADGDEKEAFYFLPIDVHSKILIVDDVYLSVGSCNKNNRGVLYEGELNASVLDATWVREARIRIFANLLGPAKAAQMTDDPIATFDLMKATAAANAEVEAYWVQNGPVMSAPQVDVAAQTHRPDGFLYPLEFTKDYLLDVGPDAF